MFSVSLNHKRFKSLVRQFLLVIVLVLFFPHPPCLFKPLRHLHHIHGCSIGCRFIRNHSSWNVVPEQTHLHYEVHHLPLKDGVHAVLDNPSEQRLIQSLAFFFLHARGLIQQLFALFLIFLHLQFHRSHTHSQFLKPRHPLARSLLPVRQQLFETVPPTWDHRLPTIFQPSFFRVSFSSSGSSPIDASLSVRSIFFFLSTKNLFR